jgi:ribonuclease T1
VFSTGLACQFSFQRRATLTWGLPMVLCLGLASGVVHGRPSETGSKLPPVALTTLPVEAQTTHRLISRGGPFPHGKDGVVFGNRERLLPLQPRGFYREYTVRTQGAKDRGARRIVCGGLPPTQPQACFYTSDHYASFSRIVP